MNMTQKQFIEIIATIALIEATGSINGKPTLGLTGAQEVFLTLQEFAANLEKQA
ncbi:hypothetical protein UFOVP259_24 [uncultured Caudovirales phage]|uniref:Uncharacterized protein n=1 Tax=uncultured Caudovirales phage TaxID=2100421 RepID=A0A6J5LGZ5_9CAUD|nr:hypothetical protein UFOVP259_24 [uncultured Caudovirales phage]